MLPSILEIFKEIKHSFQAGQASTEISYISDIPLSPDYTPLLASTVTNLLYQYDPNLVPDCAPETIQTPMTHGRPQWP
jgi:hypothetical protein